MELTLGTTEQYFDVVFCYAVFVIFSCVCFGWSTVDVLVPWFTDGGPAADRYAADFAAAFDVAHLPTGSPPAIYLVYFYTLLMTFFGIFWFVPLSMALFDEFDDRVKSCRRKVRTMWLFPRMHIAMFCLMCTVVYSATRFLEWLRPGGYFSVALPMEAAAYYGRPYLHLTWKYFLTAIGWAFAAHNLFAKLILGNLFPECVPGTWRIAWVEDLLRLCIVFGPTLLVQFPGAAWFECVLALSRWRRMELLLKLGCVLSGVIGTCSFHADVRSFQLPRAARPEGFYKSALYAFLVINALSLSASAFLALGLPSPACFPTSAYLIVGGFWNIFSSRSFLQASIRAASALCMLAWSTVEAGVAPRAAAGAGARRDGRSPRRRQSVDGAVVRARQAHVSDDQRAPRSHFPDAEPPN